MAKISASDIVSAEAPDDLYDSLILQCVDPEFKLSKKNQQPQVTCKWEILGVKTADNKIERELIKNDRKYVVAGLYTAPTYFTLSKKAIRFFQEFWSKATGRPKEEFEIDDENPDLSFMNKLVMSAVVKAVKTEKTKPISEEERDKAEAAGTTLKAEVVKDDEGNTLYVKQLVIDNWNRRFSGELPAF